MTELSVNVSWNIKKENIVWRENNEKIGKIPMFES